MTFVDFEDLIRFYLYLGSAVQNHYKIRLYFYSSFMSYIYIKPNI